MLQSPNTLACANPPGLRSAATSSRTGLSFAIPRCHALYTKISSTDAFFQHPSGRRSLVENLELALVGDLHQGIECVHGMRGFVSMTRPSSSLGAGEGSAHGVPESAQPTEDVVDRRGFAVHHVVGALAIARLGAVVVPLVVPSLGMRRAAAALSDLRSGPNFGGDVVSTLKAMGSQPLRTAYRRPWQNGIAERWVSSVGRELLDHVIVLNRRHLRRLVGRLLLRS